MGSSSASYGLGVYLPGIVDVDVAHAFSIPLETDYRLDSLEFAVLSAGGGPTLDVYLTGDRAEDNKDFFTNPDLLFAPDMANVLEHWSVPARELPDQSAGGIIAVQSGNRPLLGAGDLYWLVLSVAETEGGQVKWLGVSEELEPRLSLFAERFDSPLWEVKHSQSGPFFAFA